jgi:biopolymer transport protein ExbB/TolQ
VVWVVRVIAREFQCRVVSVLFLFCSSFLLTSLVDRITEELKRLERQEELAEEALLEQQKKLDEALSRLMRLRKLRRILRDRGVEMVKRGLNAEEMEEADRREEEERRAELERVQQEEAQLLREVQSMSGGGVPGLSSFGLDSSLFPFLGTDDIPAESSGRSS